MMVPRDPEQTEIWAAASITSKAAAIQFAQPLYCTLLFPFPADGAGALLAIAVFVFASALPSVYGQSRWTINSMARSIGIRADPVFFVDPAIAVELLLPDSSGSRETAALVGFEHGSAVVLERFIHIRLRDHTRHRSLRNDQRAAVAMRERS